MVFSSRILLLVYLSANLLQYILLRVNGQCTVSWCQSSGMEPNEIFLRRVYEHDNEMMIVYQNLSSRFEETCQKTDERNIKVLNEASQTLRLISDNMSLVLESIGARTHNESENFQIGRNATLTQESAKELFEGFYDNYKYPLRLIQSDVSNPTEGRLEIFYRGVWGTICSDNFTDTAATVACSRLGDKVFGKVISNSYGQGTGLIWLDDVNCTGNEHHITRCSRSAWGINNCDHSKDVAILCDNELYPLRLVRNGVISPTEGRLEILYGGEWGTICSDYFSNAAATVACSGLGDKTYGQIVINIYGQGSGRILLDDVRCNGSEHHISKCYRSPWGFHNCDHSKDVAILCDNDLYPLRLIRNGVTNTAEGRLEIFYGNVWGTVCRDYFTDAAATVACLSLGNNALGQVVSNSYGQGSGRIWLDDIKCNGSERHISRCTRRAWGINNCDHSRDVAVRCVDVSVRLIQTGVINPREGRLEIKYQGVWGTVCDDDFDDAAAQVACLSLGYGRFVGRFFANAFGAGVGTIWLDNVKCRGNEFNIASCSHNGWGVHNCGHGEDVSISCR